MMLRQSLLKSCLVLLLGVATAVTSAPGTALALPHTIFTDATEWVASPEDLTPAGPYAWAMESQEIANATAWEIINGYPGEDITYCNAGSVSNCDALVTWKRNPSFKPGNTITHGEFAAILARGLSLDRETTLPVPFPDVTRDGWYYNAVANLVAEGIVRAEDHASGTFGPETEISRAQLAAWTARAVEAYSGTIPTADLNAFRDADQIPAHLRDDVAKAVHIGIIKGVGNNLLAPMGTATRVQSAAVMVRTLSRFSDKAPALTELEAVVKAGIAEFRHQYELILSRDTTVFSSSPHYLAAKEEQIKNALRPFFSEQFMGPIYYGSGYKNGRGVLTFVRFGFTILNEYELWSKGPRNVLHAYDVTSVKPAKWPNSDLDMVMDGFAKMQVTLQVDHTMFGERHTNIFPLELHLKKQEGSWIITQMIRVR